MDPIEKRIMEIGEEIRELRNHSNDIDRLLDEHLGVRFDRAELRDSINRLARQLQNEEDRWRVFKQADVLRLEFTAHCACGEKMLGMIRPEEPNVPSASLEAYLESVGWGTGPVRCPKCFEPGPPDPV